MIKIKNDWEHITFYVENLKLENINFVEINKRVYKVQETQTRRTYQDHGHEYSSTFKDYFIEEPLFGKFTKFKLSEVIESGVKVYFLE